MQKKIATEVWRGVGGGLKGRQKREVVGPREYRRETDSQEVKEGHEIEREEVTCMPSLVY